MAVKLAKAPVTPIRQRTQYTCMATSMTMALQACGHDCTEDEVNQVMGCRPGHGARWEDALAAAQHYGCRAHLTVPATLSQVKGWTDAGKPVLIAWNPEGRPWSHASLVYDVTDGPGGRMVHVADPNIPNPEKTSRVLPEDEFYAKWYEKWPDYLVRRPACVIEREIDDHGRQIVASHPQRTASRPQIEKGPRHNQWFANQAFVDAVRREFSDLIVEGVPPGGYVVISDTGRDDVRVVPARDRDGWYELEMAASSRGGLLKMLGAAVGVRVAAEEGDMGSEENTETAARKKKKAPKRRNEVVREMVQRGWGSGRHKNKGQRGRGQKGKGKNQRHPKHKKDYRRMAQDVAATYLFASSARLDRKLRRAINADFIKRGLDGNGRFRKPEEGYSLAVDIMARHGLELDTVVSSHLFKGPSGQISAEVAFSNEEDPFSPQSITNSVLHLQFTELRPGAFEVVAYMS